MAISLTAAALPREAEELRTEVRGFLADELMRGSFVPRCDSWLSGIDTAFSRKLGKHGWLGLTWPVQYGGRDRSPLERFVVTEELLAAGAPVAAHWIADRQIGPNLLRFGTDAQKQRYLPAIARGEYFFCIGMSEPDTGSDLASVRCQATPVANGWLVNGTKIWTSAAHVAHAMVALVRTAPVGTDRHAGLTQLIVELPSDGVEINPIAALDGHRHFNEVVLRDVFVPAENVIGEVGNGWHQVTAELAYERSGPERLLSTMPLLIGWCGHLRKQGDAVEPAAMDALGRLLARAWALRQMSIAVAAALAQGRTPGVEAAMVKDLGTQLEREIVESIRVHVGAELDAGSDDKLNRMLADSVLHVPAFTLRGGTTEILRGIVAKGIGVR
jgi:alkylation response protein AidB-like acyl-CoA dehydrogenase